MFSGLLCGSSAEAKSKNYKLPAEVTLSKQALQDKIRGAWAGQIIGCTYGGPTEFKYNHFINDKVGIKWDEHRIKWYFDHAPGLYDDVYMDLTFVEVFEKEGLDAPVESFAKAFAYAGYPLWHANQAARYNIVHGLMPPASGHWENNPHADDIDFQIEADYAGIMAPGMVNSAAKYTDDIGHIMNYGDGWYGGVYVAAMYSLAMVSDDIDFVVNEALKVIPKESNYYKCMADVIAWSKQYKDWHITWALVESKYGFDRGCPGGVYSNFNIDAVLNSAYIIIGLLYGGKDFYKTIDISTRCGQDSDCNPASSGGILGAMLGYNKIPAYWKTPLYEVEDRPFAHTDISFNRACKMSMNQALKVIALNGGSTDGAKVSIKTQAPQAVRLEESFKGHFPIEKTDVKKTPYGMKEFKFNGNGVVFTFHFKLPEKYNVKDYEARVEAYLDGRLDKTMLLPTTSQNRSQELYWRYNLPVGDHTVSFNWVNKPDDVNMVVDAAVIYSDKPQLPKHK